MLQTTTLSLAAGIPQEQLDQITQALADDLSRVDLDSHPVDTSVSPGVSVEVVSPGTIALGAFTSAGVTALIGCVEAALAREPGLVLTLHQPDGTEVEFTAGTVAEARRTLALAVSPPA